METVSKTLTSGKDLKITIATFEEANALWMAVNKDLKSVNMASDVEIDPNLIKDLFCTVASSKDIRQAMQPLLRRCLYNGEKIDEKTFDSREAREDYLEIFEMVATENLLPFTKRLVQKYKAIIFQIMSKSQASEQTTPQI